MAFRDRRNIKTCENRTTSLFLVQSLSHRQFVIITAADVMRTVSCKIPRVSSRHRNNREERVPVTVERDLKLMVSILGFEHYTLIMLGTITEYPMLYTPWLLMHLCVILVEIVVFFVRFFLDGLHVKRNEMLQAIFTLYNWLQVFCLFYRQTRRVA
ncbi:uncharacterized protein LOC109857684 isoform X2 [Pseudomyrmex gracilis]|uniref:uncharacterized protein LOC109857684 isoform X2 n=1 Tax=Pseudomyrmex gracilis TaxID=219809 RepID=UPI0009949AF5|nr:uncharacterized protein LOC109857684 isoform X2 [Pseudomyrmex gracilis]